MNSAEQLPSTGPGSTQRPTGWDGRKTPKPREFAPFLGLGIQLAASVLIMYLVGWWVDEKCGTYPFGQIGGGLIGCVAGLITFVREASRMDERQHDSSHED